MKKVLSIISAAILGLMAVSCVQKEMEVFDPSEATAPILGSYTADDDNIVVNYTPGVLGYNESIAPYHSLAIVTIADEQVSKVLTTKAGDGTLTVTTENLSKALITLGHKEGDKLYVELVVRASLQDPTKDNGRNGYIDSEGRVKLNDFEIFLPTGDPYARYTEKSDWSVIGSITEWSDDIEMVTNGTWHVAKNLKLSKGDEVKFRKDASWDVNLGYAEGVETYELGTEFAVAQDGANIVILEDGTYDLLVNPGDGVAKVTTAQGPVDDPYASYTEVSAWSLIGSFNSWNDDYTMYTNGTLHVAKSVTLEEGAEVKFRKDADWTVNFGYAEGVESYELGVEFDLGQDGANIVIAEAGCYDFILDADGAKAKIIKSEAVAVDPYAAYKDLSDWSLIGSFQGHSWNYDFPMYTNGTLHVAKAVELKAADEVKFRKDADWTVNFGYGDGVESYEIGTEFSLGQDGPNIVILEDGKYDLILDPENATAKIIASVAVDGGGETPEPVTPTFEGWSVIGSLTGWSDDIDMTKSGAFWVAREVEIAADDQFKFRKAHDWAENIGAEGEEEPFVVTIGEKYTGVAGGKNLGVPAAGKYDLYVNPDELTFYVMASGEIPAEITTWGVVGTINNWGNDGADLALIEENGMLVHKGVELTASDQFKIRFASDWAENRGAPGDVEPYVIDVTQPVAAVAGGKNLGVPEDGTYDVWYDELNEIIYVVKTGEALPATWGVVGDLTGWGGERSDYTMTPEGEDFLVRRGLALTTSNQFKIRYASDWAVNRGAPGDVEPYVVDANTVVEAVSGGKNLGVSEDGNYDIWYDVTNEKLYVMAEGEAPEGAEEPEEPTPTTASSWGVIGDMNGWGADIEMTKDGDWFIAEGVEIAAGQGFKIRGDGDWAVNRGAEGDVEPFEVTVGEGLTVVQNGKNLTVPEDGTFDIYYDSAEELIYIMAEGEAPEAYSAAPVYNDYIYAIGADTGWGGVYYLRSGIADDVNNGIYKGFGYLSGEFKFKPNEGDWDGDWEYDGEGKIADNGGSNCPAPDAAGYYMIVVDLTEMTYELTLIETIGVVGPGQAGGWGADTDLAYDAEKGAWTGEMDLAADEIKFRANDDWAINWGGTLEALTQGGDNIAVAEEGTYEIELYALCDGKAHASLTKK